MVRRRNPTPEGGESPHKQQELCFRILRELVRREERAAREVYSKKAQELKETLLPKFPPIASEQLDGAMAPAYGQTSRLGARQFLYFEAYDKGGVFIPVSRVRFDFSREEPEFSIRCIFFSADDDYLNQGFRFETPEGSGGNHDFYHAQPIRSFDKGGEEICRRVNTSQPSIPLDARCPVTLTLAFVLACYGRSYLKGLIGDPGLQQIQRYIEKLHWRARQ